MRILFLGEPASPNTMNWIEALRALNCEVFLASVRPNNEPDVISIGSEKLPPRLRIMLGVGDLKKVIARIKPDLLLAYRVTSYGYLAARTKFKPLVLAAQNEGIVYLPTPSRTRAALLGYFARYAIEHADMMHSWGENITSGLLRFGAKPERVLTLHRGIDVKAFGEATETKNRSFDIRAPRIISTRSLHPEYLLDQLVEAFSLLLRSSPNARLDIAGDGPEREKLQSMTKRLGIQDNVRFHGALPKKKLISLLRNSDIYASLIQTEGLSSSLLEAILCGLLPIVADMPASRLLLENGKNAIFKTDDDVAAVAALLERGVAEKMSMSPELSLNAEKIAQEYDSSMNQKRFLEKYKELVEFCI